MTVEDASTDKTAPPTGPPAAAPEAPTTGPPAGEPPADKQETFTAEYVAKLRAEAAKHRTDARSAQAKAKKFDEAEAAQKSDLEKAQEEAAQSKAQLETVQTELLRARIASEKKLPAALAQRLRGSSQEEMEADAEALMADLGKQFVPKSAPGSAATGAGVAGGATDYEAMSPKELVKLVRGREG